jgi:hypothetical protein
MKRLTCFIQDDGGTDMQTRGITWAMLGVAMLAMLLAAPGVSLAGIIHRYSFTTDASDSVGGANGILEGGATVSGGQLFLNGTSAYVELPIGNTIASLQDATFETWVTWRAPGSVYSRIFDFGQDTTSYMFLSPRMEKNTTPFVITVGGSNAEQAVNSVAQLPDSVEMHVAVVFSSNHRIIELYLNGSPSCILFNKTLQPSNLGATANNWLGRSQFSANPFFTGSINEFRIYDSALSPEQIAASFRAGPNAVPPE